MSRRCINCFKKFDETLGGGEICPHCAYNSTTPQIKGGLKYYTLLQGRYRLGRVNCANSEGFTYTAWDVNEECIVDVREFFPSTISYREGTEVFPAQEFEEKYKELYSEFLEMGRCLMRLRNLNAVVGVDDMFWDNNTAYMVYHHYESISLKSFVEGKGGRLNWSEVQDLFLPMMNSLSAMHSLGVKHLGISYDTLRVCKDAKMRLGEFSIESVRRVGRGIEPDLVQGCPAYEQYTREMKCGEMSDVYAFAASILYSLTGALPPPAIKRMDNQRLLISKELLRVLPEHSIKAIAGALQINQEQRIGSFERFRAELTAPSTVTSQIQETEVIKTLPRTYKQTSGGIHIPPKIWLFGSFIITACVVIGVAYCMINYTDFSFKKWSDDFSSLVNSELETSVAEVVIVPNMVKDQYKDWQNKLKDASVYRFKIKVSSQEFNDNIPEGQIISQEPRSGQTIEVGSEVKIVVSRGHAKRALPQITGMQFARALEKLEREGFEVERQESYSESVISGNVLWYGGDMSTGDEYDYGTKVTVVVSIGKENSEVTPTPIPGDIE